MCVLSSFHVFFCFRCVTLILVGLCYTCVARTCALVCINILVMMLFNVTEYRLAVYNVYKPVDQNGVMTVNRQLCVIS